MYKALLVDDEPVIIDCLKDIIAWEEYGFEVFARLKDGYSALNIIEDVEIDLLVTDIRMPDMDGLTLIKHAKQIRPEIRCIVLSGHDDFQLVKQALQLGVENYLLKPVNTEELSSTLNTVSLKLASSTKSKIETQLDVFYENTLCRWVNNEIDFREFIEHANMAEIDIRQNEYAVASIKPAGIRQADDKASLIKAAKNVCANVECSTCNAIVFNELNGNIVIIFSGEDLKKSWREILSVLDQCMKNINRDLNINSFITLGDIRTGYKKVHESYAEAKSLQDYQLIFPSNSIISSEVISKISINSKTVNYDSDMFYDLLLQKNYDGAFDYLNAIFGLIENNTGINPENIRNISVAILYDISRILTVSSKNEHDMHGLSFSNILKINDIRELQMELRRVLKDAFAITQARDNNFNPLIRKVLAYIEENYSKDISIKTLSGTFNINASYLGQLFKSETGELFTNYLNKLRIEKAREILQKTHFKAHEVSKMVGYTNDNYFNRVFKKLTGSSPVRYRDGHA